ncbi:MAG: glutamate 5-kinase [Solobacterium sp.]|nr:glutamate 5-kinase [Solobacterium sp.]
MEDRKRIVVKVGTSTVCHPNGAPNLRRIEKLCRTLSDLKNTGHEIILVTSGAIGAGTHKMKLESRPKSIAGRQAAAAVGQCELMSIYDRFFLDYGSLTGQILLTKGITENETGRKNVIATLNALLEMQVIPIINENDSVATEEIVYGDNDTLSAVVAAAAKADLLVLLSDIEGLFDTDPTLYPDAQLISIVHDYDKAREAASGSHSEHGTGGMITKIHAATIAREAGIETVLTSGADPNVLYDICEGVSVGTLFTVKEEES